MPGRVLTGSGVKKVDRIAQSTYCRWLGHAPEVSEASYVAPTAEEFTLITRAGEA